MFVGPQALFTSFIIFLLCIFIMFLLLYYIFLLCVFIMSFVTFYVFIIMFHYYVFLLLCLFYFNVDQKQNELQAHFRTQLTNTLTHFPSLPSLNRHDPTTITQTYPSPLTKQAQTACKAPNTPAQMKPQSTLTLISHLQTLQTPKACQSSPSPLEIGKAHV